MKPIFSIKLLALITLSFFTNTLSAINFKTSLTKTANNAALPAWQQPHAPDYAAELQKYKPSKKEPDKKQASELIANAKQNVSFLENKGQMMDTEGKPVPFVLFKAEAPGMNVYITEKGLTYVFIKLEEDENEEREERNRDKHQDLMMPGKQEENMKAEMAWINVNLKGATIKRENIIKEEQSTEHFNYFYGHCPDGIYDVYQYKKLTIKNVYPNIDWVFYNSQKGGMKYDFIVHPGANPNDIKLIYESETPLDLDEKGNLQLKTKLGSLTENAPYSYLKETNTEVKSSFKTTSLNKHEVEVAFNIETLKNHNNSTLVIDPQLVWGTFYVEQMALNQVKTDLFGNVFIVGTSGGNTFFPTSNPGGGAYFQSTAATVNAILLKFNTNNVCLWATYYGGSDGLEMGNSICTDASGNVFITGIHYSSDFPLFNPGGGAYYQVNGNPLQEQDCFILKFNNFGVRLWATSYGGSSFETPNSICCDNNGNVFVVGNTSSLDFPLQNSGTYYQNVFTPFNFLIPGVNGDGCEGFILKFNNVGVRLWASYYGGDGLDDCHEVCCDNTGNVFVVGQTKSTNLPVLNALGAFFQANTSPPLNPLAGSDYLDGFILKFDNLGSLLWATYYGGNKYDGLHSICTDLSGNIIITGCSDSFNFPLFSSGIGVYLQNGNINPTTNFTEAKDGIILKFSNMGQRLWATCFGGSNPDHTGGPSPSSIVTDACGNIIIVGTTGSADFPIQNSVSNCNGFFMSNLSGVSINKQDFFIAKFSSIGVLYYSSYFGGSNINSRSNSISIDSNGYIFLCGNLTPSVFGGPPPTYPLINPGGGATYYSTLSSANFGSAGYIAKLIPSPLTFTSSSLPASACNSCDGSATFSISCGEAPFSYVWSNGLSVLNTTLTTSSINNLCSGVYNITVTACTQTLVETYTISGTGAAVVQANILPSNTICAGQSLTLSANAAISHTWAGPNNFTATTQNAAINNAQVTSTGVYTITIDPGFGCALSTATVAANVQAIQQPTVSFTYQSPYCTGTSVVPANLTNGFSTGGVFSSDAGLSLDATTGAIDLTNSTAGTYTVNYAIASAFCRTAGSNTAQVQLNKSPVLELNPNNLRLACGQTGTIIVSGADDYTWTNSAPLNCTTCSLVIVNPDKTTEYCVTGTSTNCQSTACVLVSVEQSLDVPNAFTPNGDNNNDEFCLQGWAGCVQSFAISVFDRWGQEVFTSNKANFCWDGTYQGKALNTAVFVYSIKANIDGKQISKKGNITLLK